MLLYSLKKSSFFCREFREAFPVDDSPEEVPEDGAEEPADEHGGEDGDTGADDGVGRDELEHLVGLFLVFGEENHHASRGSDGAEDGGSERVAAAGGAEGEEGIPVEDDE